MLSHRRYLALGAWIVVLGSLWALIAWISPDFAVTTVAGIIGLSLSILSLVALAAAGKGLIQISVGTSIMVTLTFIVGVAWLYAACHVSVEDMMDSAICRDGKPDLGYVVTAWLLGLIVSLSVLLAGLIWGRKQPPRS